MSNLPLDAAQVFVNVVVSVQYQVSSPAAESVQSFWRSVSCTAALKWTKAPYKVGLMCLGGQVERDNLYSAFYKLTDSRSQITSYVFDVGARAASFGPWSSLHLTCG